jgi:hypothetical protein
MPDVARSVNEKITAVVDFSKAEFLERAKAEGMSGYQPGLMPHRRLDTAFRGPA